jgi:hypothetical protein
MSESAGAEAAGRAGNDLSLGYQSAVNQALDEFRAAGRPDLVDEVAGEVRRPQPARPVVLVAGETKRGKSSLVNVLMRRPGLSPAGVDLATTAYVVLGHGDAEQARVATMSAGQVALREIGLDEIGEWATTAGNAGNMRQVLGVEVSLPVPLLRSVTLVDTPGRGGLDSAHGAIGVPVARQAGAVIFVLDAGAPVTTPELAFLREAAGRVDAVIVVVTKTDDYPGWEKIVADDRALLARYAPALRGLPVLPVSARVAEAALEQPPGPLADELWQESGLATLERLLTERVAGRAGALRACNVLLTTRDGLAEVGALAAAGLAVARGDPALRERLATERKRLAGFGREGSRWSGKLGAGVQKIKIDHAEALGRELSALQRRCFQAIEKSKRAQHDAIADQLVADIEELAASLSERAGLRLADLMAELLGDIDSEARLTAAVALASEGLQPGTVRLDKATSRELTRVDKLAGMVSFSSGKSMGGIVTALPLFAGAALPVIGIGLGAGAVFSVLMRGARRDLNLQSALKSWCQAQLGEAQRLISSDFARRMVDVQEELREVLADHLDRRRRELDEIVASCDQALAADQAGGQQARRAVEAGLSRIRGKIAATDRLLARLGAFRAAGVVTAGPPAAGPQPAGPPPFGRPPVGLAASGQVAASPGAVGPGAVGPTAVSSAAVGRAGSTGETAR